MKFILHKITSGIKRRRGLRKRKNSPKWGSKPLQSSPGASSPVRHVRQIHTLSASSAFPYISSDALCHQFVPCHLVEGGGKKSLSNFVKNSLFCLLALKSTTRELYIWVPAPDDVKTGADPKPVAQRVPQRGRLRVVFPSCASVTSSCRGEPRGAIWGGPGPERGGTQSSKFQLAWQGRWGTGDWGRRGELGPPACTSNCLNIHFPYSLLYRRGDSYCHVEG